MNSRLSDNASNKVQVGYTHFDDFRNPMSSAAPAITIQNGAGQNYIIAGHEPFSINNVLDQKVFQLSNNMTISKANHTYTIGFSYEKFEFDNSFNLGAYGYAMRMVMWVLLDLLDLLTDFLAASTNGLLSEALTNAQAVKVPIHGL